MSPWQRPKHVPAELLRRRYRTDPIACPVCYAPMTWVKAQRDGAKWRDLYRCTSSGHGDHELVEVVK